MAYTLLYVPPGPPPPPVVPAFVNISWNDGHDSWEGVSHGPFTVEQYAKWTNLSVPTAQAVLDQAVAEGRLLWS
ncbi:MAG: hypothetical protein JWM06_1682 [Actinomycetia bacterium]|nr:hypothetical protein [Actinomycetes bacterium]